MKYALFSDVHGNLAALDAMLSDAAANGADRHIFLGDGAMGLGFPNEVIDRLAALPNLTSVSGNEDDLLLAYRDNPSAFSGQYETFTWHADHLSGERLQFLRDMPRERILRMPDLPPVYLAHGPHQLFGKCAPSLLNPANYALGIYNALFTSATFPAHVSDKLTSDAAFMERLSTLPDGVYAFGHTHIQWQWRCPGKLLVNPGALGLPLDFDHRAAYALLSPCGDSWEVELRRVDYSIDAFLEQAGNTPLARAIRVWYGVLSLELATAREQAIPFLRFAEKYADGIGDTTRPFVSETWHAAYDAWRALQEG